MREILTTRDHLRLHRVHPSFTYGRLCNTRGAEQDNKKPSGRNESEEKVNGRNCKSKMWNRKMVFNNNRTIGLWAGVTVTGWGVGAALPSGRFAQLNFQLAFKKVSSAVNCEL